MKNAALRYTFSALILANGAGYLSPAEAASAASVPQATTLAEQG